MAAWMPLAASTESVPKRNVTSMLESPASLRETMVSMSPTVAIACSIGVVIRLSTSSGDAPTRTVEIWTSGMSKRGRARTSMRVRP